MTTDDVLAEQFEANRPRLESMAFRMLGSSAAAQDAVQDAWLRLSSTDAAAIENLGGWLTTTVARECLHQLRSRRIRNEQSLIDALPDPVVEADLSTDPESEAVMADAIGLALLVVLDALSPAERLAFVLHDLFAFPFDEVASVLGRSPAAVRQLASRARRRVADARTPRPDSPPHRQRQVVDAFFAAARAGDLAGLVEILDPGVVLRGDLGRGRLTVIEGADQVVKLAHAPAGSHVRPVWINGLAGAYVTIHGEPSTLMAFTVVEGRIVAMEAIVEPARVARLVARL